jgi:YD repeat-containing protein
MIDPLGHVSTYTYNAAGLLASETDPDGRRRTFSYDDQGRLSGETWYDVQGNETGTQLDSSQPKRDIPDSK